MAKHLSVEERECIQAGLWAKESVRSIAKRLRRSHSSIVREINKNIPFGRRQYTPRLAHVRAQEKRSSRGRHERLKNTTIRAYVIKGLKRNLSPEQIAGRMKLEGAGDISPEAIYQYIYAQVYRGGNGSVHAGAEDLRPYLVRRHKKRARKGMRKGERLCRPHGPSIDERPNIVGSRARLGDWEGDSIESRGHKPGLNSLVDRMSGLLLLSKLENKSSLATRTVVAERLRELPAHTLTLDNGPENRMWKEMEQETGVSVYLAHPYHSWERGTNENTNGLVRRYFPKGTDFTLVSKDEIARVEYALNTRPRKRLGYRTPLEVWSGALGG